MATLAPARAHDFDHALLVDTASALGAWSGEEAGGKYEMGEDCVGGSGGAPPPPPLAPRHSAPRAGPVKIAHGPC